MAPHHPSLATLRRVSLASSLFALFCSAGGQGVPVHPADVPAIRDLAAAAGIVLPDPVVAGDYVPASHVPDSNVFDDPVLRFYCDSTGRVVYVSTLNMVWSTLPDSIGSLTETNEIKMFVGFSSPRVTLPQSITRLTKLSYFQIEGLSRIGGYRLTGSLPAGLGALTGLLKITIQNTAMTGSIPETISRLQSLTYLNIGNNLFTGFLPEALCALPLEYLSAGGNAFYGGLVSCMLDTSPNPAPDGFSAGHNFLTYAPSTAKGGLPNGNCYEESGPAGQKSTEECARLCGLPTGVPPDSWFSRPCVATNPQDLFLGGEWNIGNVVFRRKLDRSCVKSVGPCGVGNCKAGGGWCRSRKTQCCCMPGKDPVYGLAGNVISCSLRTATARTLRLANSN